MNKLETKAKEYADLFYAHESETEEVLFKKADIRTTYKQGFEDATKWHYPSEGDYPKIGEKVLCKLEGFPDDEYRVGFYGRYKLWYLAGDIEKNIECWQYIIPPKEVK